MGSGEFSSGSLEERLAAEQARSAELERRLQEAQLRLQVLVGKDKHGALNLDTPLKATAAAAAAASATAATEFEFDSIESALVDFAAGKFVVVVDDVDRENEGDLIIAAEAMTPEKMAFMIRHTSGVICTPMLGSRIEQLNLPIMVENNTDRHRTAFTVTVDFRHGTSTGISAADRSATSVALTNPNVTGDDFLRPGHIFPLRARERGVLERIGHTEASVDLCRLSGLQPVGVLCEIAKDDGTMARRDYLEVFSREHGLKMITIADLVKYRQALESKQ
ncbi:3,4-dihydroxy-2-butanone 4-phosphate synthase [Capsaspora owczarzaki ATCC 30864]|uniref:3,4-dihydroxy-2-butanone 4-phosphate synthase n=1 Tax=Capsaspora owczarzaki (strain ATCC 30864) TaxID=595528 RepID=A0A0D2TZM6_CAPO3|nr:3,4-dihydroxy-2-butanone 4-phosphate synthase [Capsaspora owczarzaki ATCC 30864]KJE88391.1 3,4-dihydroxy-2-butanone 4-phosphate synthase [Capsaspora owczarzaki ATCC 30864]|eukprot:XP_004364923.1 3,4-dihydroxy-2-butanone 4-phosphate synthase [Capsaspora owczarzaki ATCC 30864]